LLDQHARLQPGILDMQAERRVRVAIEEPYWNFVAPFEGFVHRTVEIRRIVVRVLELVYALPEPIVGLYFVEGHAGAEDVNQCKAGMSDTVHVEFHQMLGLTAVSTSDVTAAARER